MPYTADWYLPSRVMLQRYSGTLAPDEITELGQLAAHYIGAGTAPVHILIDITDLERYPTNIKQIVNAVRHDSDTEKIGWVIYINSPNAVVKFMASVATQVLFQNVRLRLFETLDEALAFLLDRDVTLAGQITLHDDSQDRSA
ncbi:MAG: STAS/SEC14 domain-containing protein [Chloroflexi bacterium]|nr:STAS/SEC14 domain-containing protein [Chloroflexota bacterium]